MSADLVTFTVRLADDALIYGQQLSNWCSRGPTLEEDLALSNVALDYLGRARLFYDYAGSMSGRSEDDYAFTRDGREFTNLLMYELPVGDFAHTMVRQYLIDEFESIYLTQLSQSSNEHLSAIGSKSLKETDYHLRRSREWMLRFGLGTEESHARASKALDALWGYVPELFAMDTLEVGLAQAGVAVERDGLNDPWRGAVENTLTQAELSQPLDSWQVKGGREGIHTEHMGHLLAEMQSMQRTYPGLTW